MGRLKIGFSALVCALSILAVVAEAEAERRRPGEAALLEAADLMRQERCDDAIPLLRRAWELGHLRNALWNLAECYAHVDRPGQAIEAYQDYLEHPATQARSGDRRAAETAIARLEASVARLEVTATVDGARVLVDGQDLGAAPMVAQVGEGLHVIEVSSPGFTSDRRELQLSAGDERALRAQLELLPGQMVVTSEPAGAEVLIDDRPLGTTPIDEEVPGGGHGLELRLEGYRPFRRSIDVSPGQQVSSSVTLEPVGGTLSVATPAEDARLLVDGQERDRSPFGPLSLSPGRYELGVEAPSHAPWRGAVEVVDQRVTEVQIDLAATGGLRQVWFWGVLGLTLSSLVAGVVMVVVGTDAAEQFERVAARIETGGESAVGLSHQQAVGEDEADRAEGLTVAGGLLVGVGGLAAVASVILGFRTRFREEASTAEFSSYGQEDEAEVRP